jgi:hypothetical protein
MSLTMQDFEEFKKEYDKFNQQASECSDGSCDTPQESFDDYPDYVRAIYNEIMPPLKSGIYFSRWDIKGMAAELDEHIVMDVRERMFMHFMRSIITKEDMENVVEQFKKHIDMKCDLYREYIAKYPSSSFVFEENITKANRAKRFLDNVIKEYFE